jgi:hypothetical protein
VQLETHPRNRLKVSQRVERKPRKFLLPLFTTGLFDEFKIEVEHGCRPHLQGFAIPLIHSYLHIHLYWLSADFITGTTEIRLAQECAIDDCILKSAPSLSTGTGQGVRVFTWASVTDCVAAPELRLLIYYSVTVNYGAQKRCCGRLKRCYGLTYMTVLVRQAGGPQYTHWYLPFCPLGSAASQTRP